MLISYLYLNFYKNFLLVAAAAATFSRFFPGIKARYDYGVLIFILTFSMVSVSGYRVDEFVTMAQQRLSTILAGGAICIMISILICPVWAGETLHNSVASNIDKLANYLEGQKKKPKKCHSDYYFLASFNDLHFLTQKLDVLRNKG